jgi:RNA polymerase sigma-70 factor (ECF subfamily)
MEEREVIARLQAGDIAGLAALVRQHYVPAVRAAYVVTRDRAIAEDIVQEAFLRAYERIDQFDATRPFRPWFLRSVVNAAVTATKRGATTVSWEGLPGAGPHSLAAAPIDPAVGPEELIVGAETRDELWAALGQLSPAQRAAIVRRYYLDMTERELAETLSEPIGTVKWRLHAARARLRALLRPS